MRFKSNFVFMLRAVTEEKDKELNNQNDHHHQFQRKRPALVELIHHEAVKLFGGLQLLVNQVFVIRYTNLGSGQLIEARGKHVAQELNGIVGVLGKLGDIQKNRVQLTRITRHAPAGQHASALV